jgi:hypothetical protein
MQPIEIDARSKVCGIEANIVKTRVLITVHQISHLLPESVEDRKQYM